MSDATELPPETEDDEAAAPLPALLGDAFPPILWSEEEADLLGRLEAAIAEEIAPAAAAHDAEGRYPTAAIAALKRTGVLHAAVPEAFGGLGLSHRFSIEAQLRMAIADPAVAQVFKVHDELTREIFVYCPDALRPDLARRILEDDAILGLAVAEAGRTVEEPMKTVCRPRADGGFTIDGTKIYTTGAAEADLVAVWAFNPDAPGAEETPILGLQLNLVPAGTPGMRIHRDWDALGQRATDSGTITFEGVETDPALVASVPGRAPLTQASLRYQAGFAAILIGIGIGALREAAPFVAQRSRPWPSAGVENAADDPYVRRLVGELTADLVAAYALTLGTGDLLDAFEQEDIDRTALAIPIYAAKSVAQRAGLRAAAEIHGLMGTRSAARANGFDRYWRNARTLSLHDPVEWKHAEIGRHILTGWEPPPGLYQ